VIKAGFYRKLQFKILRSVIYKYNQSQENTIYGLVQAIDHLNGIMFYDHTNKENPFKLPENVTIKSLKDGQ